MKLILFNSILHTLILPSTIDGSFSLQDIPNSEEIIANVEEKYWKAYGSFKINKVALREKEHKKKLIIKVPQSVACAGVWTLAW